jgi:hypothetical protein
MKTNREILDEYGSIIVNRILDRYYRGIKKEINEGSKNPNSEKFNQLFEKLDSEEKALLRKYIFENINSLIFDFLGVFEEHEEYKMYYEKDGQRVNLAEISEMLKAEPIIENGWIKRFSKEIENDDLQS